MGTKSEGSPEEGTKSKVATSPSPSWGSPKRGDMNKRPSGASSACKNGACQLSPFFSSPPDLGGSIDPPPPDLQARQAQGPNVQLSLGRHTPTPTVLCIGAGAHLHRP